MSAPFRLLAACLLGLLLAPAIARSQGCGPDFLEVRGRILDPPPAAPDGVACCDVLVDVGFARAMVRTRSDGTYRACFPCPVPDQPFGVSADALCCGMTQRTTVDSCIDPATSLPRLIDLGDLACDMPPVTGMTALRGAVTCRSGTLLEPVAGCGILVELPFQPDLSGFTRTDATGEWEICRECLAGTGELITAQCCGLLDAEDFSFCPERFDVDAFVCDPCPVPPCPADTEVEVTGQVQCGLDEDGDGDLDPRPGCDVLLSVTSACGPVPPDQIVTTDAAGTYRACFPCPATAECVTWTVTATPRCCPAPPQSMDVQGCPAPVTLPTIACPAFPGDSCTTVRTCQPDEAQVYGRVTCRDAASGDLIPVAGCSVTITPVGCGAGPVTVVTAADGSYSACVPCAGCTAVDVVAECCAVSQRAPIFCAAASLVDLTCTGCAPPVNDCAPSRQVFGRVTCFDFGTGGPVPLAGCTVRVECALPGGPAPVFVTTDAAGEYAACFPCPDCVRLAVTAECCNSRREIDAPDCRAYPVDLACGDCAIGRPCPGFTMTSVSGTVGCEGASGPALAGCPVLVQGLDASGGVISTAEAVTDGGGRYEACLGCGLVSPIVSVQATATCCGAASTAPVVRCPAEVAMPAIECDGCSPCPAGFTRLQGRLRCRGGGPVAGCDIAVDVVIAPGDTQRFTTTTDAQGNYRLCMPCPYPGTTVRVTSLCCDATRVLPPDSCGPVTPVPTLFCEVPCR